ncbi:MAG: hypothetical protein RL556_539 [Actinomycetota bacterium]|jgi:iron complex transport system ATP-binding protein
MSVVIDFNNVSFQRDGKSILQNIDWQVESNQRWAVIGPNGAGKTSLLRIAGAQLQPTSGTVLVLGETLGETNVFDLRTRIGFASNAIANHIPNSESVLNAVMTASYGVTGRAEESYELVDERRARRVLAEWHLESFEERAFGTLSEGERKRVQLARSVMADPEMLLLDEPIASLDLGAREATIKVLSEFAQTKNAPAMIMVTHHLEEVPVGFTHALLLNAGQIYAAGDIRSTLTTEKVSECFGITVEVTQNGGRYLARAK